MVNTPAGKSSEFDDSYIRKAAIRHKVPYITTTAAAKAAAKGIAARRAARGRVRSLQSYHSSIAVIRRAGMIKEITAQELDPQSFIAEKVEEIRRSRWGTGWPSTLSPAASIHPRSPCWGIALWASA